MKGLLFKKIEIEGDWRLEIGNWILEIGDWRREIGKWRLEEAKRGECIRHKFRVASYEF
jgi:hypothetical protein